MRPLPISASKDIRFTVWDNGSSLSCSWLQATSGVDEHEVMGAALSGTHAYQTLAPSVSEGRESVFPAWLWPTPASHTSHQARAGPAQQAVPLSAGTLRALSKHYGHGALHIAPCTLPSAPQWLQHWACTRGPALALLTAAWEWLQQRPS